MFNFADADIMRVSLCFCLYFALLFAVLRHLPQCFTIGEAMVVTETIALLSVDAFTDLGIKVNSTHWFSDAQFCNFFKI